MADRTSQRACMGYTCLSPTATRSESHEHQEPVKAIVQHGCSPQCLQETCCHAGLQQHLCRLQVCHAHFVTHTSMLHVWWKFCRELCNCTCILTMLFDAVWMCLSNDKWLSTILALTIIKAKMYWRCIVDLVQGGGGSGEHVCDGDACSGDQQSQDGSQRWPECRYATLHVAILPL